MRTGFGRRYFTCLGVLGTYYLTIGMYYIGWLLSFLWTNASSLKPTLVIDPMSMLSPPTQVVDPAPVVSIDTMFLALRVFVIVALVQKGLAMWRKIKRQEASLSVYGGDSIFSSLLVYIPESWVTMWAVNKDDFFKRYVEPICCYVIGGWVLSPLVDPLTGSLVQWSAIAMMNRAYCIRLRFQIDLDNTNDSQQKVGFLFDNLGDSHEGERTAVRASLN